MSKSREDLEAEAEEMLAAGLEDPIVELLEEVAQLRAELAALRRVEVENLHMEREQHVLHDEHRWCVGDASNGVVGWGLTMVEALAMYDEATKEQR